MAFLRRILVVSVAVALIGIATAVLTLRASLATLEGTVSLSGLSDAVTIERDALGIVTLRGSSRVDLARATGFVHAQDRFFQMDLARRRAAGELAALFGRIALDTDRGNRLHRFRHRARRVLAAADPDDRALLEAYADGVNAGLDYLSARPWEYLILGSEAQAWLPEDALLVSYSMFLELNDSRGALEAAMELLDSTLPPALVDFISPPGTEWDAPMEGEAFSVPPIPGPEVFAVERAAGSEPLALKLDPAWSEALPGSNNWAVGSAVSASGSAMVANDMHLGLRVPNTFYRLRLELTGEPGMEITGASLPGTPLVVAGSNGRVAWGFTNSYGDWTDVIRLEIDPDRPGFYRSPRGWEEFECFTESIAVAGSAAVAETICETVWGPVLTGDDPSGSRALKWIAHEPEAVNLELRAMESASNVEDAMAVANRTGMPPQNIVVADREGRVAWTIAGRIPLRSGFDPSRPADWARPDTGWSGWLAPEDYPRIVDPQSARVWTANARVLDDRDLETVGNGGYALGARASRIRDRLFRSDALTIRDMLDIQLDDDAFFFQRWRDLALATLELDETPDRPGRRDFRRLVDHWSPRAERDSVGFLLVYEFRQRALALVFEGLTGPVRERDPGFSLDEGLRYGIGRQFEGPAWNLLVERPRHLLHPAYTSWDELLLAAIDDTIDDNTRNGPLAESTWGSRNMAGIRHPLSSALTVLSPWLDMPAEPLDGATHMPRVQQSAFGASERFAVSPGREEEGYFHMPTGQSGHPLSPFYRAGHEAWVRGEPTPFLPGPALHSLTMVPPPSSPL